jgi:hypothetical protein
MKFATPIGIFSIGFDGIKLSGTGITWGNIIFLVALLFFIRAWLNVIRLAIETTSVLIGIIGAELSLFWLYNIRLSSDGER